MNREFEKRYARVSRPVRDSGKSLLPHDLQKHALIMRHYNARARLEDAVNPSEVKRYATEYDSVRSEMRQMFGDGPIDPYKKNSHE